MRRQATKRKTPMSMRLRIYFGYRKLLRKQARNERALNNANKAQPDMPESDNSQEPEHNVDDKKAA